VFGTSRTPAHNTTGSFELLPLDVDSEASVQTCIQKILERTGRIDLLVNNAGFAQGGALEENSLEAHAIDTQYEGERDETAAEPSESEPGEAEP